MITLLQSLMTRFSQVISNSFVRVGISVIFLGLILRQIDLRSFLSTMLSPEMLPAVLIAFCFHSLNMFVLSYRWALLFFPHPTQREILLFTKANYVGAFYSSIFPTSNGGDFLKWAFIHGTGFSKQKLFSSVFVDRFVGVLALFLIGTGAIIVSEVMGLYQVTFPIMAMVIGPSVLLLFVFLYTQLGLSLPKFFPHFLQQKYSKLLSYNAVLRRLVLISIFSQFVTCLSYFVLGIYWGLGVHMAYIFIFLPIIALLLLLPISIGGIGYKEMIFVYFFSQVGIEPEMILFITTSITLSKIAVAMIGWLLSTSESHLSIKKHQDVTTH